MSDKYQSDTSSSATQNTSRFVKNPLLSAAVTNLTLDDFTHNAVLMPAMPFVAAPVSIPSEECSSTGHRDFGGAQGEFQKCFVLITKCCINRLFLGPNFVDSPLCTCKVVNALAPIGLLCTCCVLRKICR